VCHPQKCGLVDSYHDRKEKKRARQNRAEREERREIVSLVENDISTKIRCSHYYH